MIFVKKDQNVIRISKHKVDNGGMYRLNLTHNMTNSNHIISDLKNNGSNSGYWIFYGIDFNGLQSGEYTYTLCNDKDEVLETGLLQMYSDIKDPISYKKKDREKTTVYRKI